MMPSLNTLSKLQTSSGLKLPILNPFLFLFCVSTSQLNTYAMIHLLIPLPFTVCPFSILRI